MGIRYYGWAISPEEVNEATDDPWPVIRRADKRHELPGWTNTDFDKAWRLMQQLFRPSWDQIRPAYELVAGDVTYPYGYEAGYLPHIGVLPADLVPAIARDVASVTPSNLLDFCASLRYSDEQHRRSDHDYLGWFLPIARDFTADAAARGHGIVYMIR